MLRATFAEEFLEDVGRWCVHFYAWTRLFTHSFLTFFQAFLPGKVWEHTQGLWLQHSIIGGPAFFRPPRREYVRKRCVFVAMLPPFFSHSGMCVHFSGLYLLFLPTKILRIFPVWLNDIVPWSGSSETYNYLWRIVEYRW